MTTVHLQSIGEVPAKPASELELGDVLVWNFGYKSRVVGIEPSKSGKSAVYQLEALDTGYGSNPGRKSERRFQAQRLVAVEGA